MKIFLVEFEEWDLKMLIPDTEQIVAEDKSKAYSYFRKHFNKRILKIIQIK